MSITRAEAQAQLDAWLACSRALAQASTYTIGEQTVTREQGAEVRAQIAHWAGILDELDAQATGSTGPRGFVFARLT